MTNRERNIAVLILAALLFAFWCKGATTNYIKDVASGNNTGADWTHALTNVPYSFTRGDYYYWADGTYTNKIDFTNQTTSTFIYWVKATPADHGTSTGWSDSMGDGQTWLGRIEFNAGADENTGGYLDINGYSAETGAGTNNCGFKIGPTGLDDVGAVVFDSGAGKHPECKFRYIDIAGPMTGGDMNDPDGPGNHGFYISPYSDPGYEDTSGMLITHCNLHGLGTGLLHKGIGNSNLVMEYNNIYDLRVTGWDHANVVWAACPGGTFRYNRVWNYNAEGIYFGASSSDWKIYGNIFFNGGDTAPGVDMPDFVRTFTNIKIYNNTFVNITGSPVKVGADATTSGVEIYNNLMWSCGPYTDNNYDISIGNGGAGITLRSNIVVALDNTTFFITNAVTEVVNQSDVVTNYVNITNNFHLRYATNGFALASPYDADRDGVTRGADGVWDVGAYEYSAAAAPSTNTTRFAAWGWWGQ